MMTDHPALSARPDGEPACGRAPLVEAITTFLAHERGPAVREIRESLELAIDEAGPDALSFLGRRLASAGDRMALLPRRSARQADSPRPRRPRVGAGSGPAGYRTSGGCRRQAAGHPREPPVVRRRQCAGGCPSTGRLGESVGPVDGRRRTEGVFEHQAAFFQSLFRTIKVPQSGARSSDEAVMNAREVGTRRSSRHSGCAGAAASRRGPSGFRRGEPKPLGRDAAAVVGRGALSGLAGTRVLPVGLAGTERLFPIEGDSLNPVRIVIRVGRPLQASALRAGARGNRRLMMDCAGLAIQELLPHAYRGRDGNHVT